MMLFLVASPARGTTRSRGTMASADSTITRLKQRILFITVLAVSGLLRLMPRRFRLTLGRLAGALVFALDARHRKETIHHLDLAFGESKDEKEKVAIARGAFEHFGAMFFELMTLGNASGERIGRIVEFEGLENYEKARAAGKGVVLVAAHFGNWEVHAIAHGHRLGPIGVVARVQDNPYFTRWLEKIRTASGNRVLYKERALKGMLRLLKKGETIAVLVDQNVAKESGVFVDFFGRQAAATPVVSWLAVKTGAALIPVFTLPLSDGRYRLIYDQPIDANLYRLQPRARAVQELTQRAASVLESYVRRHPQFWLWMHRRWKTRPADEAVTESTATVARGVG